MDDDDDEEEEEDDDDEDDDDDDDDDDVAASAADADADHVWCFKTIQLFDFPFLDLFFNSPFLPQM